MGNQQKKEIGEQKYGYDTSISLDGSGNNQRVLY
jgi:hypothetical protein